jgi:hypothetical protein
MGMSDQQEKTPLVKLTGMWINKSEKTGEIYLSGYMGSARLFLFKNGYKEGDNEPDYNLFVGKRAAPKVSTDDAPAPRDAFQEQLGRAPSSGLTHPDDIGDDDDIPF